MLSHDREIELVCFSGRDQLGKVSAAMSAQKRVHVNDSTVIDVRAIRLERSSLGRELLDGVSKALEAVTSIGKRKLRQEDES